MGFSYNVNVLNQKGSPALYTDTFANRPPFGYAGRLFIANDTSAIYEDTGTAWVLIANVSSGAGTLQQVTTNGNTSNVGISITAGGLSTNSLTDTALTLGSVLFAGAAGLVTQDNASFFWDDTNNRLGLNTTTPGNTLDVHFAGTASTIGINNTAGNAATIVFANTGANKWRIGNSSSNTFDLINVGLASNALSISSADNRVDIDGNTFFQKSLALKTGSGNVSAAGYTLMHSVSATGLEGIQLSLSPGGFASLLFNSSNNRQFTFPNADGTVALTSDLSSYLPLSGGTLTGALNGTSASFSGNIISTNGKFFVVNTYGYFFGDNTNLTGWQGSNGTQIIQGFTGGTEKIRITAGGNILIGSTTDDTVNKLQVNGNIKCTNITATGGAVNGSEFTFPNPTLPTRLSIYLASGAITLYNSAVGNIGVFNSTTGVYTPLSDINKKKDFEDSTIGLNAILNLKPTLYRMLDEENTNKHLGFIAQEVKEFIPEAYVETVKGKDEQIFIGLDFQAITTTLVKAVQDQQKIIESLIKRIELLENK
jgi:hypothetical protein